MPSSLVLTLLYLLTAPMGGKIPKKKPSPPKQSSSRRNADILGADSWEATFTKNSLLAAAQTLGFTLQGSTKDDFLRSFFGHSIWSDAPPPLPSSFTGDNAAKIEGLCSSIRPPAVPAGIAARVGPVAYAWFLLLGFQTMTLLAVVANLDKTDDLADLLLGIFALPALALLPLPGSDKEAAQTLIFEAVANKKSPPTNQMWEAWKPYIDLSALNILAPLLGIPGSSNHTVLAKQIFSHAKFRQCRMPLDVSSDQQDRNAYLVKLAALEPPRDEIDLIKVARDLAKSSSSRKRKHRRNYSDDDDSSSDDDQSDSRSSRSEGIFSASSSLHPNDEKLLNENKFVTLAALASGKGPRDTSASPKKSFRRVLVIPTTSNIAAAALTLASQVICILHPSFAVPNFEYIQFITGLFATCTPAGVHEIDRICRSYCAQHKIAWEVPTLVYHHVMCAMVANTANTIIVCPNCGNKDCNIQICHYSRPTTSSKNTSASPSKHVSGKNNGVCYDWNKNNCSRGKNCKFNHLCSFPGCTQPHMKIKNH
jgi:hypothetical protein